MSDELERAAAVLGPLEGRIMRALWSGTVTEPFVVRAVQVLMPELAYTTVMTTLRRLADKGLLASSAEAGQRAHHYRVAQSPAEFLAAASAQETSRFVERFGDAALAAFAAKLGDLTPEQRKRLEDLRG
ncbi:BlaI/MecI/CopY family transcriptional regulator [Nonomuraea sp. NPDC051941]|uniref:BlaI/MecI/CopY family transcriptional regulator n=1 Tax=Nonomuraea sp. NPDC051941 TaxID=3364373 RepID=UPI0037C7E052